MLSWHDKHGRPFYLMSSLRNFFWELSLFSAANLDALTDLKTLGKDYWAQEKLEVTIWRDKLSGGIVHEIQSSPYVP